MSPHHVHPVTRWWTSRAGGREVMGISWPLIVSMGTISVQMFTDRMFLAWYSPDALAASLPAGALHYTLLCVFLGLAQYTGTLVAHYHGAGRPHRAGQAVWQGVWAGLAGALLLGLTWPIAPGLFEAFGHPPGIVALEVEYYRYMLLASAPWLISAALSGFDSGLGLTRPVMVIQIWSSVLNALLNPLFIFGWGPVPEMGVAGAALATAIAASVGALALLARVITRTRETSHGTRSGWRPDVGILRRLVRFGLPSGVHMFIGVLGFTILTLLVGNLGEVELAAASMAFQVYLVALMPAAGLAIGVELLVGQARGAAQDALARRCLHSGLILSLGWAVPVAAVLLAFPQVALLPFGLGGAGALDGESGQLATLLLRGVVVILVADAVGEVAVGALRGAGDTAFVMRILAIATPIGLVGPIVWGIGPGEWGLFAVWMWAMGFWTLMAALFVGRWFSGAWTRQRVIEAAPSQDDD